MDVYEHNRQAWNRAAQRGERWSVPSSGEVIAAARRGEWAVRLTPDRDVQRTWFGELDGAQLLGLASGGGQQMPIFAAVGARVTSFDASDEQLALDRQVADREGLGLETVRGNMAHLEGLEDASFDLIFHPISNVFAQEIAPVWRECWRVLRPGGRLLAGFMNPAYYLFDYDRAISTGEFVAIYPAPYSDLESLSPERLAKHLADGQELEYGHSLEEQIGGQLRAGFMLEDLFEDRWTGGPEPFNALMPTTLATLARKPLPSP